MDTSKCNQVICLNEISVEFQEFHLKMSDAILEMMVKIYRRRWCIVDNR